MPKLFAIGDIHGCHRQLLALLDRLPLDKAEDTLVFLGDYINRGPDSRKVLDTLLALERSCRHAVFLKGNHEQALLEYALSGEPEDLHLLRVMGVETTAGSYGAPLRRLLDLSCLPPEHQQFLCALKLTFAWDGYLFTHADYDPSAPPDTEATLLASRRLAGENRLLAAAGPVVVFGHLPYAMPLVKPDRIGIDTGAVYGNMLTAVQLPERKFYHA